MEVIKWIEEWYIQQWDGDWEHQYGFKISTLDNPGWVVEIDFIYTNLEGLELEYQLNEKSENDWYGISVKNNAFKGIGDPSKLEFILQKFKNIVIDNS